MRISCFEGGAGNKLDLESEAWIVILGFQLSSLSNLFVCKIGMILIFAVAPWSYEDKMR